MSILGLDHITGKGFFNVDGIGAVLVLKGLPKARIDNVGEGLQKINTSDHTEQPSANAPHPGRYLGDNKRSVIRYGRVHKSKKIILIVLQRNFSSKAIQLVCLARQMQ